MRAHSHNHIASLEATANHSFIAVGGGHLHVHRFDGHARFV